MSHTLRLSFHFLLAGEFAKEPKGIRSWYARRHHYGDFIILDNGAPEEGCVGDDSLIEIANDVLADEVVMPDVLRNADDTIARSSSSKILNAIPPVNRMIVPQGTTWGEWIHCLEQLLTRCTPSTIGLAKWIEDGLPGGRLAALEHLYLKRYDRRYRIHLLGLARPLKNELGELSIPQVRSMDTALPYALAQQGLPMHAAIRTSYEAGVGYDSRLAERNIVDMLTMSQEVHPNPFDHKGV